MANGPESVTDYDIAFAVAADIPEIVELQSDNLPDRGGTLSVPFSREWFAAAISEMPVIVARRDGRLVGYLFSATLAARVGVPIWQAMMRVYTEPPDAYVYGPVCVAKSERGRGVASAMFAALKMRLPGREGILFVRADNSASLRAHIKMGMRQVAEFVHADVAYVGLVYAG
jgi:L-amino acid N-acyltransferase YncA